MDREPLPDYSSTIRAQIEREVAALQRELRHKAQYVELGYLVNTHHGKALFETGDRVGGLPMRIDRTLPRTIRVCADNVRFTEDVDDTDEDGRRVKGEREWYEDVFEQVTW